ncbi:MAG: hypothetical protein QG566_411 [Patescibacteria group bacterium]|nr:hypothetical protein [Patescibacteria group bacterium]
MISNSMKIPEAGLTAPSDLMELFSRLFKNGLIEVKMHIKLFSAELQAAILLMYSYHTFTKDHLESKSIFSEIMENSRITSKILFDLGYYTLAGRKYHGENPNAGTFPHANFIDINSYSKKRAWELKNMHLGIIVDHNSYPDWEEKMEDFDYGYFFGRSSDNYYNYR